MRNLVDHRPIHDKHYKNPCLEVKKLQNLGFLWIETYFLLKKKMFDHYRPIHVHFWQKVCNSCLKVKKSQKQTQKQKTNKQTKTYRILNFLGTETQFLLEIWFQAYSWQKYENSCLKVKKKKKYRI